MAVAVFISQMYCGRTTSHKICYAMSESYKTKQKIVNDSGDKKVMGHLSSPLKNQTDILQTTLVYDRCLTWMYTPSVYAV